MQQGLYSVFDKKAVAYSPPFSAPTDGAAIRSFVDLAKDGSTMVCKHPADFQLVRIGSFDFDSGQVSSNAILVLMEGSSVAEADL